MKFSKYYLSAWKWWTFNKAKLSFAILAKTPDVRFFKGYEYFSLGHFKGTIILPYVQKIVYAFVAQFQTYGERKN